MCVCVCVCVCVAPVSGWPVRGQQIGSRPQSEFCKHSPYESTGNSTSLSSGPRGQFVPASPNSREEGLLFNEVTPTKEKKVLIH